MGETLEMEMVGYLLKRRERSEVPADEIVIFETLSAINAILKERIMFFETNNYRRNDAISLVVISDTAWQSIRILSDLKNDDSKWFLEISPNENDDLFADYFQLLKDMKWVFSLHSYLRHPTATNKGYHPYIFNDPWPKDKSKKLIETAKSIRSMANIYLNSVNTARASKN